MVDLKSLHKNKNRVLLTEVLPYEVILGFDTEHFFNNMNDPYLKEVIEKNKYVATSSKDNFKISFDYHIRRSGGEKSRKLSLMHPLSQLECVDFYEDNKDFLLYYTSLSPFSLRHPNSISKSYDIPLAQNSLNIDAVGSNLSEDDNAIQNENVYGNYFEYTKFDLIYKFFESFEFINLEKKFSLMRHLDIASCFYHIHTFGLLGCKR